MQEKLKLHCEQQIENKEMKHVFVKVNLWKIGN